MPDIKKVKIGTTEYNIEANNNAVKVTAQTFTDAQKNQAKTNLGLGNVANLTYTVVSTF